MGRAFVHVPILLEACMDMLAVRPGGTYVDGTLGGGGHTEGMLRCSGPDGRVLGIDRDGDAIVAASQRLAPFGQRFQAVRGNFHDIKAILDGQAVDGILLDLGVSSYQLDEPSRGFSYQQDAPLDMRMDRSAALTAMEVVNGYGETELARIIREYGEERYAGRIAGRIVQARARQPIRTTGELAELIKQAIPAAQRRQGPHPAKRTFQALRIEVNDELAPLAAALEDAVECLKPGGRLAVITFHSLEDRIAKQTFRRLANPCTCPPDWPVCTCGRRPVVRELTRRAAEPTEREVEENPRSRSARLRAVEKCSIDQGV